VQIVATLEECRVDVAVVQLTRKLGIITATYYEENPSTVAKHL
jgi:hypothetical protein